MMRLLSILLLLVAAGGAFMAASLTGAQEAYEVQPTCDDSLQALLDAATPGSTVQARTDCIYREQVTVRSPLVLEGQDQAEIRGSDVWATWIPVDGLWVSANQVPVFETHGTCREDSDGRCLWPEQVFRDGVALYQAASGVVPGPGQFSLNAGRQVVVADDPTDAVMEVTTRTAWLVIEANDVTLQGFTMKHAATDAQHGAVRIEGVSNWTVRDNVLSDAHGAPLYFRNTSSGRLVSNELFNGGQLGFGGTDSADIQVRGNAVHDNNTEEFWFYWESGGAKITRTERLVIDGNEFNDNSGRGIWCDIDCQDVTISNNLVHHNQEAGIFFEISSDADIVGNLVWENNWGSVERNGVSNAGILIGGSSNTRVYENIVAWNGDGIGVFSQCRKFLQDGTTCDLAHPWNQVSGNEVHGNLIVMGRHNGPDDGAYALGWVGDIFDETGDPYTYMFSSEASNVGHDNVYWFPPDIDDGEILYAWDDVVYTDLQEFNATPGEENGEYVGTGSRDRILEDAGIPLAPEEHPERQPVAARGDDHPDSFSRWAGTGSLTWGTTRRDGVERFIRHL